MSPFGTDDLVHVSLELSRPVEESLGLVQDLVRSSRRLDQRLRLLLQVGDVVRLDGLLDDPLAAFAGGLLLRQVEVVPDALVHAVGLVGCLHQVVGAPAEQPQEAAGQEHLWMEQTVDFLAQFSPPKKITVT